FPPIHAVIELEDTPELVDPVNRMPRVGKRRVSLYQISYDLAPGILVTDILPDVLVKIECHYFFGENTVWHQPLAPLVALGCNLFVALRHDAAVLWALHDVADNPDTV